MAMLPTVPGVLEGGPGTSLTGLEATLDCVLESFLHVLTSVNLSEVELKAGLRAEGRSVPDDVEVSEAPSPPTKEAEEEVLTDISLEPPPLSSLTNLEASPDGSSGAGVLGTWVETLSESLKDDDLSMEESREVR